MFLLLLVKMVADLQLPMRSKRMHEIKSLQGLYICMVIRVNNDSIFVW